MLTHKAVTDRHVIVKRAVTVGGDSITGNNENQLALIAKLPNQWSEFQPV